MNLEKGNMMLMKEINKNALRHALKTLETGTVNRLSELTGLTSMTVGALLDELLYDNEVFIDELLSYSGGRPARSYRINADFSQSIIFYGHEKRGKDTIFVRIINLLGEVLHGEEMRADALVLDSFVPVVERLIQVFPNIKAIGFGFPGTESAQTVSKNDYKGISGTRFTEYYKAKFGFRVLFENDTNAAVSGYCRWHPEFIFKTVCYLYFPGKYPPGCGLWIQGLVHRGRYNLAGEVSYLPLGIDWKKEGKNKEDDFLAKVSLLVASLCGTLAPDLVVLHGEGIGTSSDREVRKLLGNLLPEEFVPEIALSGDFNLDYEKGMIQLTLDLMEQS